MLKTGVFTTFSRCFITGNYLLSIKYQIDKIVSWKKIANALIVLATVYLQLTATFPLYLVDILLYRCKRVYLPIFSPYGRFESRRFSSRSKTYFPGEGRSARVCSSIPPYSL